MSNILTSDVIADRMLAKLDQEVTFLDKINTTYDSYFRGRGAKVGDSVRVKVPNRAKIRHGRIADLTPIDDVTTTVALDEQVGVDIGATSAELALEIDDFDRDYITPNAPDLVAAIEAAVLAKVVPGVYNVAGTGGSFNDMAIPLQAGLILDYNLAPKADRIMLVNPYAQIQAVKGYSGLFNDQSTLGRQYRKGAMGMDTLGFDWYQTTQMPSLTRGTASAGYLVNGAGQAGGSLVVDGGTGTLVGGDTFTIAGVYAVNPQTKAPLGYLQQFTASANYAGGNGTVSIAPAMVTSGTRQNVSNAPADNAAITVSGTSGAITGQNLAFTKDAFYFVTADLPKPPNMTVATRTWNGINIRFIMGYDITNDMEIARFDVIYGGGILRPDEAVRIPNTLSLT